MTNIIDMTTVLG